MVLLVSNGLRFKPHPAELTPGSAECAPVPIPITLPLPVPLPLALPMPANAVATSVIDGEESTKSLLAEMAGIIEAPVAV